MKKSDYSFSNKKSSFWSLKKIVVLLICVVIDSCSFESDSHCNEEKPNQMSENTIVSSKLSWPKGTTVKLVQDGPFNYSRTEFEDPDFARISWRFPSTFPKTPLKGIVLLFPGCTHDGDDFFRLCEERLVVEFLLKNNYAAVGLTSSQGKEGCWYADWPATTNPDTERVVKALNAFFTAHNLNITSKPGSLPDCSQTPIFIFGGSSGGLFVSIFAHVYAVNGVIVHISPGLDTALEEAKKDQYPPTVFSFMPRDTNWASEKNINLAMEGLKAKGIPTTSYKIGPWPLNVDTMAQLLDARLLSRDLVSAVFNKLKKDKRINAAGMLKEDPRQSELAEEYMGVIEKAKQKTKQATDNEELLSDNLVELFNSAYGQHELSHVYFEESVAFLHAEHTKRCAK